MAIISDYLYRKASVNRIPLGGVFELSPVCNFNCKMCYVRKTPEQIREEGKRLLSWKDWLELGEQCCKAGTLFLLLTGGEPFLYPGFKELYIRLHKMGFVLSINTNGTMIDKTTVEWLKEYAPSRINITLYGNSPETYKRICGNANGYEKTLNAINLLQEAGIPIVINASMIPENVNDLEEIIDFGKEKDIHVRMSTYMFPPARREKEECDSRFTPQEAAEVYIRKNKKLYSPEEYKIFCHNILAEKDDNKNTGAMTEYMNCRAGRSSYWVSWDGKMTACGMVEFPVVTYPFQEPFDDCWDKITEAVRQTEVLHDCQNCKKRGLCKPCVAMIYTETGTINEKAPYLCKMSELIIDQLIKEEKDEKRV